MWNKGGVGRDCVEDALAAQSRPLNAVIGMARIVKPIHGFFLFLSAPAYVWLTVPSTKFASRREPAATPPARLAVAQNASVVQSMLRVNL